MVVAAARALALAVLLAGCGAPLRTTAPPRSAQTGNPFEAVAVRAHPLSRLVREDNYPVRLEAHVEFFDRWGHTVKALGELRFELSGVGVNRRPAPGRASADPVRWDTLDIRSPESSSRAFDPATGTYWVRLALPGGVVLGGSPVLTVVFTDLRGERLTSSIELE